MHKWPSLQWWSYNHGHRTIPVELGTDSTNTWSESTMLLHTFMTDYMQPSVNQGTDAEVAYIAQHPLFDQMPSLVHDFEQPDLMGGEAMLMNAWIGTKGTVTPLHFDSYDNFLAQVHTWHCSSDCCTSIMADSGTILSWQILEPIYNHQRVLSHLECITKDLWLMLHADPGATPGKCAGHSSLL